MKHNEVIKYPILSEKTYAQMSEGIYTFAVNTKSNKIEIKRAVEFIFDVKVSKVNIINKDKQPTKLGRSEGFTKKIKKAMVFLSEGQINIFPDESIESTNNTVENESKKSEPSDAEKKAAEKIAAASKSKEENADANVKEETTE